MAVMRVENVIQACLDRFAERNTEQGLGTYGMHISLNGRSAAERRFRSDDRVNVYSVAKTFTALALVLAEHERRLRLDDAALAYFPELVETAAAGVEDVTLRQLLSMTSGSAHVWFADEPVSSTDLLREFITAPMEARPGERFQYTGSGPYVAARALHRATGADVRSYLMPRLFEPLGIHNPAWHTCPLGYPFAESDLFLRTEELGRFASLLACRGEVGGEQLVPPACVTALTSSWTDTSALDHGRHFTAGYGLGVWAGEGGDGDRLFRMDGRYGQYAIIAPAERLAVTVTAHSEDEVALLDAALDCVVAPLRERLR